MKIIPVLIFFLFLIREAQATLSGSVMNVQEEMIRGANIYLQGSYVGTSSDADGHFTLTTFLE